MSDCVAVRGDARKMESFLDRFDKYATIVADPSRCGQRRRTQCIAGGDGVIEIEKVPLKMITLHKAEGVDSGTMMGFTAWDTALAQLSRWADSAPQTGGYDKVDFSVEWEDGADYHGRHDLKHPSCECVRGIDRHLYDSLTFYAGLRKPGHMTEEQYQAYLDEFLNREEMAKCRQFLIAYDLGAYTMKKDGVIGDGKYRDSK